MRQKGAAFQPHRFHSPKDLKLAPERGTNTCPSGVAESDEAAVGVVCRLEHSQKEIVIK